MRAAASAAAAALSLFSRSTRALAVSRAVFSSSIRRWLSVARVCLELPSRSACSFIALICFRKSCTVCCNDEHSLRRRSRSASVSSHARVTSDNESSRSATLTLRDWRSSLFSTVLVLRARSCSSCSAIRSCRLCMSAEFSATLFLSSASSSSPRAAPSCFTGDAAFCSSAACCCCCCCEASASRPSSAPTLACWFRRSSSISIKAASAFRRHSSLSTLSSSICSPICTFNALNCCN
mmetsp:Transcript_15113/g.25047  ORF Transcript_15113/g.25047 Transcript_15113/m.25047 type:complete len:237 (+) Transcript_15113:2536-3246(+)